MKVSQLKLNKKNPRKISPDQMEKLKSSIQKFPKMMSLRPIVYDPDTMEVLGGNQRLLAIRDLGMKEIPDDWAKSADELTEEEKREFILRDNIQSGDWDFEMLSAEFAEFDLEEMGMDMPEIEETTKTYDEFEKGSLNERFIVPPFSVLDRRQKYWADRKNIWLGMGIKSEIGRETSKYGNTSASKQLMKAAHGGFSDKLTNAKTSIFDPVLCEIAYRWFTSAESNILDPFAGGSVRGIVASILGHNYTGIDLSCDQITANRINAKDVGCAMPNWIIGDSMVELDNIKNESYDLVFTCPPYFDLEVYSDDKADISNMDFDAFTVTYKKIIEKACDKLKQNTFAIVVISDVRDKNGFYQNIPHLTTIAAQNAGMSLYNECIIVDPIGTKAISATKAMQTSRKVQRIHQIMLIYYKGDTSKIRLLGDVECGDGEDV